jgi:plasmid stability protein
MFLKLRRQQTQKLNKGTKVPPGGLSSRKSKAPTMLNPWISLGMKVWQIGFEAQSVIALRMLRLAAGGARAEAEASRIVTEKILAAEEAQMTVAAAAMRGHKKHVIAGKALNACSKRVRANRRRLSR